jgi:hypothetical protein
MSMTSQSSFGAASAQWTDMSDYVAHFSKASAPASAYDVMMTILSSQRLRALRPFGFVRDQAPDPESQKTVCLSETPLHLLGRLADVRSEFGIVFRKDFILERGGNPIWYAYNGQPANQAFAQLVSAAGSDPAHPIWRVTPFVDRPGAYGQSTYFFEHEREWRVVGDVSFQPEDVAFLIIPEGSHEPARSFFQDARDENLGPCYDCPFIDAYWPLERISPLLQAA